METIQDSNNCENGKGNGGGNVGEYSKLGVGGGGYDDDDLDNISCGNDQQNEDCGGTSWNVPVVEPLGPMGRTTRTVIDDDQGVSSFLIELYSMVTDQATDSIISWGSSCTSFIISDKRQFILKILPSYNKNQSFHNFISKLNSYGFKKKSLNQLEFEHEYFQKGKLHLLKAIKRDKDQPINKPCVPINEFKATFDKTRQRQIQISSQMSRFKCDIEKKLWENETLIEYAVNKFMSVFTNTIGQKRTFLDIDEGVDFVDIEKDFNSICDRFEILGSDVDCLMTLGDLTNELVSKHEGGVGKSGVGGVCRRIPKFLQKLYNMVSNEDIDNYICWNLPNRDSFVIRDINKFATNVLPMYNLKHTSFSSFHSQLNIYGFRKVKSERHEYANEWFQRGRYDLLANIKRRTKSLRGMGSLISCSTIAISNNKLKTIQQDQDEKLIWLSNYEKQMKSSVSEFGETILNMTNIVDRMIHKNNEMFEKVKKAKHDTQENIKGNGKRQELEDNELGEIHIAQELEVNELGEIHIASTEKSNLEAQSDFQILLDELFKDESSWSTIHQKLND